MADDDTLPSDAEDSAEELKKQKVIEPAPPPKDKKEERDPSKQPS